MTYINAFIFVGIVCLIGQIILDNTNLTPGHITSLFVCLGALLSFCDIYEKLIAFAGAATSIPILSFGNLLFSSGWNGFHSDGILGIFSNLLSTTSAGICATVIFSFILSIFFKPQD